MNLNLKEIIQSLDGHIAVVTTARDLLVRALTAETQIPAAAPAPVQTLERPRAGSKVKGPKAKVGKRNGGGRRVRTEVGSPKPEGRTEDAGGRAARSLAAAGASEPGKKVSTLSGAMKLEISRRPSFTLEGLQTVVNDTYGNEAFFKNASGNAFYGNLSYWAKSGKLEKSGDGSQATFKVLDNEFFANVEF